MIKTFEYLFKVQLILNHDWNSTYFRYLIHQAFIIIKIKLNF